MWLAINADTVDEPGTKSAYELRLDDGVIFLRPLHVEDATAYLAGEDEEMAKWVSGGRSTLATVKAFIENSRESWRCSGPRRPFGIFDCRTNCVIGFIEMNLALLEPGQVNISYGIFRDYRGQGLVKRAIELVAEYLQSATDARQMVLQIAPANTRSLKVAEKAGFVYVGVFDTPGGRLARYIRNLTAA